VLKVTFANISDNMCSECELLNDTFDVAWNSSTESSCTWQSSYKLGICGISTTDTVITVLMTCDDPSTDDVTVMVELELLNGGDAVFEKTFVGVETIDCYDIGEIPKSSHFNFDCVLTTATCSLAA